MSKSTYKGKYPTTMEDNKTPTYKKASNQERQRNPLNMSTKIRKNIINMFINQGKEIKMERNQITLHQDGKS